jgi:hypothetical protein
MTEQRRDAEGVIREWLADSAPNRAPASLKEALDSMTSQPPGRATPWPGSGGYRLLFAGRVAAAAAILAIAVSGVYLYGNGRATSPGQGTGGPSASPVSKASATGTAGPSASTASPRPLSTIVQLPGSSWRLVSGALPAPDLTAYGWYEQSLFALPSGGFVALRPIASGDVRVFASTDGISWDELAEMPTNGATVSDIAESGGTIVAVGEVEGKGGSLNSAIAWTMSDGQIWQSKELSPEDGSAADHVAAGPAGFLVSGAGPGGIEFWTSNDGAAWHAVVSSGIPSDVDQPALFGNDHGYVMAQLFQPRVWHSTDGIRWTETYHAPVLSGLSSYYMGTILKAPDGSYRSFGGVYTGTGIGVPGPVNRQIWTSPDMTHWTTSGSVKDPGWIDGFASAAGGFVAAGTQPGSTDSTGSVDPPGPLGVWTSGDGRSWKPLAGTTSLPESRILAVAGDGTHVVIAAVDEKGNLQLLVGSGLK